MADDTDDWIIYEWLHNGAVNSIAKYPIVGAVGLEIQRKMNKIDDIPIINIYYFHKMLHIEEKLFFLEELSLNSLVK